MNSRKAKHFGNGVRRAFEIKKIKPKEKNNFYLGSTIFLGIPLTTQQVTEFIRFTIGGKNYVII